MKNKEIAPALKHLLYVLSLLFLYVLDTTPNLFEIGGVRPIFIYSAVVAIAVFEGGFIGGLYGILGGVLCDTAGVSVVGSNTLLLCILCMLVGLFCEHHIKGSLLTYLVSMVITVFICLTLQFVFTYGIWRLERIIWLYIQKVVLVAVYTIVLSPLIYLIYNRIWRIQKPAFTKES